MSNRYLTDYDEFVSEFSFINVDEDLSTHEVFCEKILSVMNNEIFTDDEKVTSTFFFESDLRFEDSSAPTKMTTFKFNDTFCEDVDPFELFEAVRLKAMEPDFPTCFFCSVSRIGEQHKVYLMSPKIFNIASIGFSFDIGSEPLGNSDRFEVFDGLISEQIEDPESISSIQSHIKKVYLSQGLSQSLDEFNEKNATAKPKRF